MPIKPFSFIPKDVVEWAKFFSTTTVEPTAGTITDETFGNRAANSIIGRPGGTAGGPTDIVAGTNNRFLVQRSGSLQFDDLADADIPSGIARDTEVAGAVSDAINAHLVAVDPHSQYERDSQRNIASGYAGLNAVSRTTKGVDTTDDLVIDLATKGLVLRDTQGTPHYWRITISNAGALVITDVGTTKP